MSVIEGSSVSVKTMSDGTLRISIDIEPANAQAAFSLFGAPGRAVALAALKDGSGAIVEKSKTVELHEIAPKGGEWAKLAGMWCNDPDFWRFLNTQFPKDSYCENATQAAMSVRVYSGDITSRAELDSDPEALAWFNKEIRHPFMAWMKANGIQK
jgi:hypothetical protein